MPTYGFNINDNGDAWYEEIDGENRVYLLGDNLKQDLETEMVMYAKDLKNGMMVIAPRNMVSIDRIDGGTLAETALYTLRAAHSSNRWCMVTRMEIQFRPNTIAPEQVHFIGVFEDGTSHVFHRDPWVGYWVKKDSILPENPVAEIKLENEKLQQAFDYYQKKATA